jgi:peptidyl-tRNA hydrolase, PTH1 family
MKLIVGLGNPGAKYAGTRHNVGFDTVDLLAKRHGADWATAPKGTEALVAPWRMGGAIFGKPLTFMNLSGAAVVPLLQFYKVEIGDLLVIVDEVQLETGRLRIRPSGSAGGHNGLKSIIGSLGSEAFSRLRIGVGRGDNRRDLADHVLARFEADERPVIEDAVGRSADAAETFVKDGVAAAMNRYNTKPDDPAGDGKEATGNGKPETGNGKQETGNRKQATRSVSEDN